MSLEILSLKPILDKFGFKSFPRFPRSFRVVAASYQNDGVPFTISNFLCNLIQSFLYPAQASQASRAQASRAQRGKEQAHSTGVQR